MITALTLCAAAAITWLLRVLTVTIVPARMLPKGVQRALPHVGPAVLAAIITAALLSAPQDQRAVFFLAAAVTSVVAWRGSSPLAAVLTGLVLVLALGALR
jgi:branched-subunit amino acid transport protein